MDAHARAEIAVLEERIRRIENKIRDTPSRIARTELAIHCVQIIGGNSLPVIARQGIKRVVALPSDIPVYDLSTSPTCVDGIGYGLDEDTQQVVLVHNGPPSLLKFDLWVGTRVLVKAYQDIAITGTTPTQYAQAWTPMFPAG